jgi:streptogramin lyase
MAWRPVALILALAALCLIRGSSPPGAPEDGRARGGITVWRPAEGLGAVVAGFGDIWVDDRARDRLLRVDGGSGRIRAAIQVEGRLALAVATRAVWALQSGGGYGLGLRGPLLRIDPRTNRVVATIPTPVSGENASIAFGEGAVWVTSGQANGVVYRVDPAANRVTATIGVPGGAFGIVVAAGTVWVTQFLPEPDPGIVARIDASNNRLLAPVEVPNLPGAIRAGQDAIWVTSRFTVSRIDPHTGAVTQPLHRAGDVRAVGGGSLWGTYANSAADAGVQRIDPVTGQVVATIRIPNGVLIAFGLGTLWVAQDASSIPSGGNAPDRTEPGNLYRIDPATNRVLGRPVPLPGIAPTGLAVGEGAVWVGELDGKTLTRFNLVP